jgi:hypothetical protein
MQKSNNQSALNKEFALADNQSKNIAFQLVFILLVVLLLGWYTSISLKYPYYFIWDMDYVTTVDMVLIQSGLLPDHISHTGFGMYLPLYFTTKIAYFFNVVSTLNLSDAAASLNPLAGIAELTDFIRLHTPFLIMTIVIFLSMAVYLIFDMSPWYLLFFIVFLGSQESLIYHSSMVRTELYSVFYFSASALMLALAVKFSASIAKFISLLAAGILLGLSFLTKIQSLFYIASLPLLFLAFTLFKNSNKQIPCHPLSKRPYLSLALSLVNLIIFLLLGIAAYPIPVPRGVPTWSSGFDITPMMVLFSLVFFLLFVWQLRLYATNKTSGDVFKFSACINIIALGFLLSFALHFLIYSNTALSLQYLLLDFKMIFFRKFVELYPKNFFFYISNFLSSFYYNPTLFIVSIILNLLLILGYRFKFIRITKGQLILCLTITILAFVNVAVGTRFILRDILWTEVLLNFMNLICFAVLISRLSEHRFRFIGIGGGLLIALFITNVAHACNMPARIDANYNLYGWWEDKEFSSVFGHNQPKYMEIMFRKYNTVTAKVAENYAAEHRQIRNTVGFVFKNQNITYRNIGILFEGFPAWTDDLSYKITEIPPKFAGAILVDNASIKPKEKFFFKKECVRRESEYLDKFSKPSADNQISVLTRRDLKILLFVTPDDAPNLISEEIIKTPYKVVLRNDSGRSIELQGLEIRSYCEIPLDKIKQKSFFIIKKT